jgi:hypothetical protein
MEEDVDAGSLAQIEMKIDCSEMLLWENVQS